MMAKLRLLIVGRAAWGQRYFETLQHFGCFTFVSCGKDWRHHLDLHYDGVIVACPPQHHIEVAEAFLQKGTPTMIEKPLALSRIDAQRLFPYRDVPMLVNHLHLFSSRYQVIKTASRYNAIRGIKSQGSNAGPERTYSSLWDYGPHDLAMMIDLAGESPGLISCKEEPTTTGRLFHIDATFTNFSAFATVGNGGIEKIRNVDVRFDAYNLHYENANNIVSPLTNALICFKKLINGGEDYRAGLDLSMKVIDALEACESDLSRT